MILPKFQDHKVALLVDGILREWGGVAKAKELEATLRAVKDPADYLRRVAGLGPVAAWNLVTAAVLGLAVAAAMDELIQAKEC